MSHIGSNRRTHFTLGLSVVLHIMLNGGVTRIISLSKLVECVDIIELFFMPRKHLIIRAFQDDLFVFLNHSGAKAIEPWILFSLMSSLLIIRINLLLLSFQE